MNVFGRWFFFAVLTFLGSLQTFDGFAASQTDAGVPMRMPGEFEPVSTVVISEDTLYASHYGADFVAEVLAAKANVLLLVNDKDLTETSVLRSGLPELTPQQKRHMRLLHMPHGVIWVRDFGPLAGVRLDRPTEHAFAEMTFLSPYRNVKNFADRFARRLKAVSKGSSWELDGGNFLSDGRNCYVGSPLPITQTPQEKQNVAKNLSVYGKEIGCESVRVIFDAPHEHIDMFVKILSPRQALVGELPTSAQQTRADVLLAQRLDAAAEQMKPYMSVTRIPMPEPSEEMFRTYTNSILVNSVAIVPRYELADKRLQQLWENQTARAYEAQGFAVRFVNADTLIESGGAWHCVTLQLFGKPLW